MRIRIQLPKIMRFRIQLSKITRIWIRIRDPAFTICQAILTFLGILVGWPLAAQVPVGPLKRCPAPVVVVASGWIRNQVPSRRVPPFPFYELYRLFWRNRQSWHFLTHLVPHIQSSITLFEKKCVLISSLAACCLRFSGSAALLVTLPLVSTIWNQVSLFTLSNPLGYLTIVSLSCCRECRQLFLLKETKNLGCQAGLRIRLILSCWIRIRILIMDSDPDPGGQKWHTKIEKSTEFSCLEVLDVLFWGLKAASPVAWVSFMEA